MPRSRGDCHSHSNWSDGGSPIEEMVLTAVETRATGSSDRSLPATSGSQRAVRRAADEADRDRGRHHGVVGRDLHAVEGDRGRHPRRRIARSRPRPCWPSWTSSSPASSKLKMRSRSDDQTDGCRRAQSAGQRPGALHRPARDGQPRDAGAKVSSMRGRCSRRVRSPTRRSRSTPALSAATRPTS